MKKALLLILFLALPVFAQKKYTVKPDSAEERMLLDIQGESDAAKRLAMLDSFSQKFASSEALPAAWRLYSAAYMDQKEYDKAMDAGEKAMDADSEDLSTAINLMRAAQAKPDFPRISKWTPVALALTQKAGAKRPPEMDDDDWKKRQDLLKTYNEFLEYCQFEAASRDTSAEHIKYIDGFVQLFPQSDKQKKVPGLYAMAYGQAGNGAKMIEYANKALSADPEDEAMVLIAGDAMAGDPKKAADAEQVAHHLLKIMSAKAKPDGSDEATWTRYMNNYVGGAHSILGRALLNQQKAGAAVTELQSAVKMLQENQASQQTALYFLGWAYASEKRYGEATPVLTKAAGLGGPTGAAAQDLLHKIRAATAAKR